jgi:hypothetical protein
LTNPFDPPTEVGETNKPVVRGKVSYAIQFLAFWLGSVLGALASSWLLSRDYVFDQWPSNWLLALFRTFLFTMIPFAVYQFAKWRQGTSSRLTGDVANGFLLVGATDLLSYVSFATLTSLFPTYPFRYPAVCFFVLVPLAIVGTKVAAQFNRSKKMERGERG